MKESKAVSETIKRIRKQKGITQKSIAERLHMGRSTYSKIESGNTALDYQRLVNISKILGMPLAEIIKENDPVLTAISEELAMMLFQTNTFLSEQMLCMIPYNELTSKHMELLKAKGFENKQSYENTPLCGRIYKYGPRRILKFMLENCSMSILFERNMITDKYWLNEYSKYLEGEKKILMYFVEDNNEIEIDDKDYFLVYLITLKMPGNKKRLAQFALRDFPKGIDEWEALKHIIAQTGALDGDIMCFTTDGYDSVDEIIKPE